MQSARRIRFKAKQNVIKAIKATKEAERQRQNNWLAAVERAKAQAKRKK